MPERPQRYNPAGFIEPIAPEVSYEPEFFADTVPAAFRLENSLGSLHASRMLVPSREKVDPDFDPISYVPKGYEDHAEEYAFANSVYETKFITKRIDREMDDREIIHAAGGEGMLAMIATGLVDPINFIPVGGAAYKTYRTSGNILDGAAMTARAGMLSMTAEEIALQSTQVTRTMGESALNVAAGTLLSGILGGSLAYVRGNVHAHTGRAFDEVLDAVAHEDMNLNAPKGSASAGARGLYEPSVDELVEGKVLSAERADEIRDGAQHTPEELASIQDWIRDKEGIGTNKAVKAALKLFGKQDPVLRMVNSLSVSARRTVKMLAELPMETVANSLGQETAVSVQRLISNWQAPYYRTLNAQMDAYSQYVNGRSRRMGDAIASGIKQMTGKLDGKLTQKEFRQAIGMAMRRGDDASGLNIPQDAKPFVEDMAKQYRKEVFDPLKNAAIEAKLLPEDVNTETAVSYLSRVYNMEKLATPELRKKFIETNTEWLMRRRAESEERAAKFDAEAGTLKDAIRTVTKEISTVETPAARAAMKLVATRTREALVDAVETLKPTKEVTLPTKEGAKKKARQTAEKKRKQLLDSELKKLSDEIAEDSDDVLRDAINQAVDKVVKESDEISRDDFLSLILDTVPPPIREAGADVAAGKVSSAYKKVLDEANAVYVATYTKSLNTRLKNLKKKLEALEDPAKRNEAMLKEIVGDIKAEARKASTKAARAAAREVSKDLREALTKKVDELAKLKKQHKRDLRTIDLERMDMEDIANQIVRRIEGSPDGRLPYDMSMPQTSAKGKVTGLSSPFKKRSYLIEDELIEDFLESDIEMLAGRYVRQMAPDVEITKRFGDLDLTQQKKLIEEEWEEFGKTAKDSSWTKTRDRDIRDLAGIRDRLRNVYKLPDNPMAWESRLGRGTRQLNYVRMLGGMTPSAIPDIARPFMVHGMSRVFGDALLPFISNFSQFKRITKEIRDLGGASDMLTNSRARSMADVEDDFLRYTKLERGLGAISDTFGTVSLMAPWNTAFKQLAGAVSMQRILRGVIADVGGKLNKTEMRYLRAAGIGENESRAIHKMWMEHGQSEGKTMLPNVLKWVDQDAASVMQSALNRDIERIIVTPGQDRPLASSGGWGEMGRMMFQFKTFAIACTQRVVLSGLQQSDMAALNGMMMAVSLGMVTSAIKTWDAGRGDEIKKWDEAKWLREGIDRSGMTAWLSDAHNMGSSFIGKSTTTRYASRNAVGALLGPTFGTANTMFGVGARGVNAVLGNNEWTTKDTHALRRLLPYNNLFLMRQLIDNAEAGINNSLNVSK